MKMKNDVETKAKISRCGKILAYFFYTPPLRSKNNNTLFIVLYYF